MSVNYVNKSTGDLIRVAGQGKAEYGASTERKGDIVIPATTAGLFQSVSVVFAQAMPDNDYAVVIDEGGETWAHGAINVTNKTATGFTLFFFNAAGSDAPQMTFKYRAFKLYTDTEYNNLLNNAVLTSDVTDSVENGNMNPVTSNAVAEALDVETGTIATSVAGVIGEYSKTGHIVQVILYKQTSTTGETNFNVKLPYKSAMKLDGLIFWATDIKGYFNITGNSDNVTINLDSGTTVFETDFTYITSE